MEKMSDGAKILQNGYGKISLGTEFRTRWKLPRHKKGSAAQAKHLVVRGWFIFRQHFVVGGCARKRFCWYNFCPEC